MTSNVTLIWDNGKRVKAHKDKLVRESAGSSPSFKTSDVTLVWDDGKWVKAHKDKLCRVSAGSSPSFNNSDVTLFEPNYYRVKESGPTLWATHVSIQDL